VDVTQAPLDIVGRDAELAAIDRFLADLRERFSALLIEGDAGIGKTTLFREALRRADAAGFRVLASRPGPSEATLTQAALSDLLQTVPGDAWEALPPPQRHALEVALLLREPGDLPADERAIAAGTRSLVARLAAEGPVLIAIDDIQWLDAASATVLEFVVRRLGPEPVGLLVSRRPAEPSTLDLRAQAASTMVQRLEPLSLGALQHLLQARLGASLPRSVLVRLHATSRGNPLFALEIARVLMERGTMPSGGEPLPVPDDVRELVGERVAALPAATRELLLAAALLARPALDTLAAALARAPVEDVDPAERAGIARVDDGVVTFAHPLHAAAVIATATTAERRAMHRRLSGAVKRLEERALHLASAADGPDEATAVVLEQGAAAARGRGGLHTAAELLEQARMFTPADKADTAQARGIRAAEHHMHAGDRDRAKALLEELLAGRLGRGHRAEALRLLGELHAAEENLAEAEQLLMEALDSADERRDAARIHLDLAWVVAQTMDFARAAQHAHEALAALADGDSGHLLAEALAYAAMTDFLIGHGVDWAKVERALAMEDPTQIGLIGLPPSGVAAVLLMYVGRHDEARELLRQVRAQLSDRGDERDLAHALLWSAWLETRAARFDIAASLADESLLGARLSRNETIGTLAIAQRAWIDAHTGRIQDARRRTATALSQSSPGVAQARLWTAATLALAGLSEANPAVAWEASRPLLELVEVVGIAEPVPLMFLPDAVEALVALGQLERAESILDTLERRARELGRTWATVTGGRVRGLLLAERGDLEGAIERLDATLAQHEKCDYPFERARALLSKGIIERRARRRAHARSTLAAAAADFDRLGSRRWAERARAELERIGGRQARATGELTRTERRVAELAASGLANKEIATALSITVHTVEAHLSHTYAKLGVSSRSQLQRHFPASRGR
jgi:DNA-binding CsgD family transcriptional regulator